MAADEKILVVVGVHEGKFFPPRPGYKLLVEARFSGESLLSDPVDHTAGGKIEFSTELAWEMTRKALQEHKLQRTPIKLVCVAVSQVTKKKQEIGYVLLHLKSAQECIPPQMTQWYGLYRCQYAGKRPELRVSLTVEQNSSSVYSTSITTSAASGGEEEKESSIPPSLPTVPVAGMSLPPMVLDESNGWYLFGSPSSQFLLHTVSLTLSQPLNLHSFVDKAKGPYHFRYSLLGNDITTEEFNSLNEPTDFHPERASVRIKTSLMLMKQFLISQSDIEISLCTNGGIPMCSGTVPIKPLAKSDNLSVNCSLDTIRIVGVAVTPTILVTLTKQQEECITGSRGVVTPENKYSTKTARRNLTQSLETASVSTTPTTSPVTPPNGSKSSSSSDSTPQRPYSPTITTPTVNAPSTVKFTSPKTSPLLMSNSSRSRNKTEPNRARMSTSSASIQTVHTGSTDNPVTQNGHIRSTNYTSQFTSSTAQTQSIGGTSTTRQEPPHPPVSSAPNRSILKPPSSSSSNPQHVPSSIQSQVQPNHRLFQPGTRSTTSYTHSIPTSTPQYTSSIPSQYPFSIPQYIPMNPMGYPPPPPGVLPPAGLPPPQLVQPMIMQQQQMEYQTAMELEMWKMAQEQAYKKEMGEKEELKLKMLEEEYKRRDGHREHLVKQKIEHYQSLEEQLEKTLTEVETQRKRMKTKELEMNSLQQKLNDEKRSLQVEVDLERSRLKTDHTAKTEVERLRSKELNQQLERARHQILELEARLTKKNSECDNLREHVHNKSESRLQAELSVAQLEKKEQEQKLDAAIKSKLHYKEQWSKALKEVASLKQREQTIMKEQLRKQQQELELMRDKYLQTEEQQQLQRQIADLRQETQRLQTHALSRTQPVPPSFSHPLPSHPHSLHHTSPSHYLNKDPDDDIARWIEERNILLQTGVYTHSDPTIQKLDKKIREALVAKSSHEEQSSSY